MTKLNCVKDSGIDRAFHYNTPMPERLKSPWRRILAHLQAWLIDHEYVRVLYRNFHRLSDDAWRSNQPSPAFVRKLKEKYGINTIISLRMPDGSGHYLLEKEACDRHGITLLHHRFSSREFPEAQAVLTARDLLRRARPPLLIHCKSGADRAGLMSALYRHFVLNESIEHAWRRELNWRYGHFRFGDTGKLDAFFEAYEAFRQAHPDVTFEQWLTEHYDRDALDARYNAGKLGRWLIDKVLRRE